MAGDDEPRGYTRLLRSPAAWAAAGAGVSLLLALALFDPFLFTGGDNALYYALTRALATGRGYVDLVAPGTPPHVVYPPGYPSLLVPFYLVSGGSVVALKLASWIALGALLWGVWRLATRDPALPGWIAPGAVWVVGLYPVAQLYSHRILSDLPYVAWVAIALAALQRSVGDETGSDRDRVDAAWLLGCALAMVAFSFRVAGVTLFAGMAGWALLRRHWRRAGSAAAAFGVVAVPWWLWTRVASRSGAGGYVAQFASSELGRSERGEILSVLMERVREVAVEYGTYQLPGLFWPGDPPPDPVRMAGVLVGGTLLVLGVVRVLRSRGPAPWDLYVAATLALLPLWPWLGDRYFLTLAPFLWLYILAGLDAVGRRLLGGATPARVAAGVLAGGLLVSQASTIPRQWDRTREWVEGDVLSGYPTFWREYFRAARWIGRNAPPDAVILARKPRLVWYWSERSSIRPRGWLQPEDQWRFLRRRGVTHILLEPSTEKAMADAIHPRRHLLTVLYESPARIVVVLEVAEEATATDQGAGAAALRNLAGPARPP
ncbi:MAG: hypothetical protein R3199_08060 [Gemmatimonadota bacterium]|nr:hypothetical protein [Gemmatimonadota bacterium]